MRRVYFGPWFWRMSHTFSSNLMMSLIAMVYAGGKLSMSEPSLLCVKPHCQCKQQAMFLRRSPFACWCRAAACLLIMMTGVIMSQTCISASHVLSCMMSGPWPFRGRFPHACAIGGSWPSSRPGRGFPAKLTLSSV